MDLEPTLRSAQRASRTTHTTRTTRTTRTRTSNSQQQARQRISRQEANALGEELLAEIQTYMNTRAMEDRGSHAHRMLLRAITQSRRSGIGDPRQCEWIQHIARGHAESTHNFPNHIIDVAARICGIAPHLRRGYTAADPLVDEAVWHAGQISQAILGPSTHVSLVVSGDEPTRQTGRSTRSQRDGRRAPVRIRRGAHATGGIGTETSRAQHQPSQSRPTRPRRERDDASIESIAPPASQRLRPTRSHVHSAIEQNWAQNTQLMSSDDDDSDDSNDDDDEEWNENDEEWNEDDEQSGHVGYDVNASESEGEENWQDPSDSDLEMSYALGEEVEWHEHMRGRPPRGDYGSARHALSDALTNWVDSVDPAAMGYSYRMGAPIQVRWRGLRQRPGNSRDHVVPIGAEPTQQVLQQREARRNAPRPDLDQIKAVYPSWVCSITQEVFRDPVVAADGQTYERDAITRWLSHRQTSPLTGQPMPATALYENTALRKSIEEYMELQEKNGHKASSAKA